MTTLTQSLHNRKSSATITGVSLIIMTIVALFSYGIAHSSILESVDALATLNNIQTSSALFLTEIIGWMMIIVLDLLISWALYVYLKPINRPFAMLASAFRVLYTAILAVAVSYLVLANSIANEAIVELVQSASRALEAFISFENVWSIGLIFFGIHLFLVGYVTLKAKYIPKLYSYLLIFAGVCYVAIHLMNGYASLEEFQSSAETILSVPMMIGELAFAIWLLVRGRKKIIQE